MCSSGINPCYWNCGLAFQPVFQGRTGQAWGTARKEKEIKQFPLLPERFIMLHMKGFQLLRQAQPGPYGRGCGTVLHQGGGTVPSLIIPWNCRNVIQIYSEIEDYIEYYREEYEDEDDDSDFIIWIWKPIKLNTFPIVCWCADNGDFLVSEQKKTLCEHYSVSYSAERAK